MAGSEQDIDGNEKHLNDRVLAKAADALERDLCDRCLGRLFARSAFGLTNEERGRAIRVVLALTAESLDGERPDSLTVIAEKLPVHVSTASMAVEGAVSDEKDSEWNIIKGSSSSPPWEDTSGEEGGCWLCQDLFDSLDALSELVELKASGIEFSTFLIGCRVDPGTSAREQSLWERVDPTSAEPLKEEVNREVGKRLDELWPNREVDKSNPEVTFIIDPLFKQVDVQIRPLFISGRYRKMIRGIPQTRWPCHTCRGKGCDRCNGTGSLYQTSVEQLIGPTIMNAASGENYKLHGMGREDVDVLTLGTGRPFILEISSPGVRTLDLEELFSKINESSDGKIEVSRPEWSKRKDIPELKSRKVKKRYSAVVSFPESVDEEKLKYGMSLLAESPIEQRTPKRVSHRRADLIRERSIHDFSVKLLGSERAEVTVLADGGLYIKELLHGDEGRTRPSLASILDLEVKVDSLTVLDVLDEDG